MDARKRREGAEGVEGKASSRAKCWWEGADQLGEAALALGSPNDSTLHAETSPRQPTHTPPQPPNHGGALSEIKEQRNPTVFQLGTGGLWITQHSPKAGQNYPSRKMPWDEGQSRAEASLLRGEGPAGQREGLADRCVLLRQKSCQSITYKTVGENKT